MYCYSEQHMNICFEVFKINVRTYQTESNGKSAMKVGGLVVLVETWRNKAFLISCYPLISTLMAEILWMEHNLFFKNSHWSLIYFYGYSSTEPLFNFGYFLHRLYSTYPYRQNCHVESFMASMPENNFRIEGSICIVEVFEYSLT